MMKATVGGVMIRKAPEAKAVQNVDLLISFRMKLPTYQMSASMHRDPIFPTLNLASVHSTCLVQIARSI